MYDKKRITQNFSHDFLAYYLLNIDYKEINTSDLNLMQSYLNDSKIKLWILINSS